MTTGHVLTKSASSYVIFLFYLLCLSDLYTLSNIPNTARSGNGLCQDFATGNYRLWTNSVLGNVRYTTKKLFATTSFNCSRLLFYENSCCSFNLPRLKLVGLIHPNPGPTIEATTNINNSCQNRKTTAKYKLLLYERSKHCQQGRRATSPRYKHGCVGYYRDMAKTGHQQLRDISQYGLHHS